MSFNGSNFDNFNNSSTQIFIESGSTVINTLGNITNSINNAASSSLTGLGVTANRSGSNGLTFTGSNATNLAAASSSGLFVFGPSGAGTSDTLALQGGKDAVTGNSFVLKTIADGTIMNNFDNTAAGVGADGLLRSGSKHNIRYEISNVNNTKGTFTLLVRAGNDNHRRKQTLE